MVGVGPFSVQARLLRFTAQGAPPVQGCATEMEKVSVSLGRGACATDQPNPQFIIILFTMSDAAKCKRTF